jgi:hypothetical protein
MLFFLIKTYKKKAATVAVSLTLLLAVYQAQITAQLFYSDQMRYNDDVRLAYELNDRIIQAKGGNGELPVAIIGKYHTASRFKANYLPGETIGFSIFGTGRSRNEITFRSLDFMKSLGINYEMPELYQMERAFRDAISMPYYPDSGCVKNMGNYIVIRLSEELN